MTQVFFLSGKVDYLFGQFLFSDAGKVGGEDMLAAVNVLQIYNKVFGIVPECTNYYNEVEEMVSQREEAREQKDFKKADELREQIKNLGYEVNDTAYGPLVKKLSKK